MLKTPYITSLTITPGDPRRPLRRMVGPRRLSLGHNSLRKQPACSAPPGNAKESQRLCFGEPDAEYASAQGYVFDRKASTTVSETQQWRWGSRRLALDACGGVQGGRHHHRPVDRRPLVSAIIFIALNISYLQGR